MNNLEQWQGKFGDDYIERNRYDWRKRREAFVGMFSFDIYTILEVGANIGNNVKTLSELGFAVIGVEPNKKAVVEALDEGRAVVLGSGYQLPFPDNSIDLVFTCGVLMHIPDYEKVMAEIWRVARRYALAIEYMGEEGGIPYRELDNMLWKRPAYVYPGKEVGHGKLGQEFDFCHYQLFQKT